jgi:sulfopropanediol 3-dehydrogenase
MTRVGRRFAYREHAHTPGDPVRPVEIVKEGPPRSQKLKVRMLDGEYAGLEQWIPQVRLIAPWVDAGAVLEDERRMLDALDASKETHGDAYGTVAKVAGVKRVVAIAAPRRGQDGKPYGVYEPMLYTMASCGADQILCVGGVQALAAVSFGMEEVEPVDMIVGAGNAYVAEAKRQLFGQVGIDLLAGPTEIAIIADETADPHLLAADLLGQAEHGPATPAVLITTSRKVGEETSREGDRWLEGEWPTKEMAGEAWRNRGEVILCESDEEMVKVSDEVATEHLEVQTRDPDWFLERLTNYGSLFLGEHSTVAYSDKAIGTNHILPTNRAARYTGGLWVGKFTKTVTYQKVTAEGTEQVAPAAAAVADGEFMFGHALTCRIRQERVGQRTGAR